MRNNPVFRIIIFSVLLIIFLAIGARSDRLTCRHEAKAFVCEHAHSELFGSLAASSETYRGDTLDAIKVRDGKGVYEVRVRVGVNEFAFAWFEWPDGFISALQSWAGHPKAAPFEYEQTQHLYLVIAAVLFIVLYLMRSKNLPNMWLTRRTLSDRGPSS